MPTLRTLCVLALPLLAAATSRLQARASVDVECCDVTVNPLSPLGIDLGGLLQLLGIPLPNIGVIGAGCLGFNLDAVLNNTCTNDNIFNCQQTTPLSTPLGNISVVSIGCNQIVSS